MVMLMVRRGADEEDEVMLSIKLKRRDEDGKHKQSKKMKTMMVVMLSIQHRRDTTADEGGRESKEKR